jgi:hypothetical protein
LDALLIGWLMLLLPALCALLSKKNQGTQGVLQPKASDDGPVEIIKVRWKSCPYSLPKVAMSQESHS